jgi:anti-sigma-K factor RskA
LVAALQSVDSGVSFVALYDADAGTVRLVGLSGAPVPERDFELWAIEGEGAPISMGVVGLERHSVPLSEQVAQGFGEGTVLAVTLEPEGGSPTGGPTGPVVAQGAATAI